MNEKKLGKKKFEVWVYERPYKYEVEAVTPEKAEAIVINKHWYGNYDDIQDTRVFLSEED